MTRQDAMQQLMEVVGWLGGVESGGWMQREESGRGSGWGNRDLSRWRQLGRGRWLIRGARGRVRGCVGVVCAFPFWGRLGSADGPSGREKKAAE